MGIQQSSSSASSTRSYAGASLPPEHGFLTWKMRASLPALKLNSILLALKPDSTKVWLSPKLDATSSICFTVIKDGLAAYSLWFTLRNQ